MSRPHEDRERHTLVDHRPGGTPITFPSGRWLVLGVAHVTVDRIDACVSAYETLVEQARAHMDAGPAAIMSSVDRRRVLAMVAVRGHDGFRRLSAAWDDHHRSAQHRAIATSVSLGLYEVATALGFADIDPESHDTFVYEHFERALTSVSDLFVTIDDRANFRGATIFHSDDGARTAILSRFAHAAAYEEFRSSRRAVNALGSPGQSGSSSFAVHPLKTFASV